MYRIQIGIIAVKIEILFDIVASAVSPMSKTLVMVLLGFRSIFKDRVRSSKVLRMFPP